MIVITVVLAMLDSCCFIVTSVLASQLLQAAVLFKLSLRCFILIGIYHVLTDLDYSAIVVCLLRCYV